MSRQSQYSYEEEIYNNYLEKRKIIKGKTLEELQYKIDEQLATWSNKEKQERLKKKKLKIEEKAKCDTKNALSEIEEYKNILSSSLNEKLTINFDSLKIKEEFKEFNYKKIEYPLLEDIYKELHVPEKNFFECIFTSWIKEREEKENEAKKVLQDRINEIEKEYEQVLNQYNQEKLNFEANKNKVNNNIMEWENDLKSNKKYAVEKYIRKILKKSNYPKAIKKHYTIEYCEAEKTLIISYEMPNYKDIPDIIEYRYLKTKNTVSAIKMKKDEFEKFYDNIIYQITLKTINEVFNSTETNCIDGVIFNGWVNFVDGSTGQDASSCIISIMVKREEFKNINLSRIVYKECIKRLKGIFAGKLISLIPVKPILDISKEDKRFVESKEVLVEINDGTNLASMPWEDFEHLVRELFELKFSNDGAEVKITQRQVEMAE